MNASMEYALPGVDRAPERAEREVRHDVPKAGDAPTGHEALLAVVAHDLRTPLNGIVLSASLLEHQWGEGTLTDPLPLLKGILRQADRLNQLIADLLDVSRIARGTLSLSPTVVTAEELIRDAFAMLGPIAAEREVELTSDCAASLPPVLADRRRIEQVFANLIENALRFTLPGGRVTVAARRTPDGVAFAVSDEGPGIAADEQEHLFEPFFRGRSARGPGTGLGLFIVRTIVDAHNGKVLVESTPGAGSTFTFVLRHVLHTRS